MPGRQWEVDFTLRLPPMGETPADYNQFGRGDMINKLYAIHSKYNATEQDMGGLGTDHLDVNFAFANRADAYGFITELNAMLNVERVAVEWVNPDYTYA